MSLSTPSSHGHHLQHKLKSSWSAGKGWGKVERYKTPRKQQQGKKKKVSWLSPLRACCHLRGWGSALCSHHPHQFGPNLLGAALQVTSVSPSSASGQRWHHSAAARRWRSCTVPQVRQASPAFCLVPPSRVEALLHAARPAWSVPAMGLPASSPNPSVPVCRSRGDH